MAARALNKPRVEQSMVCFGPVIKLAPVDHQRWTAFELTVSGNRRRAQTGKHDERLEHGTRRITSLYRSIKQRTIRITSQSRIVSRRDSFCECIGIKAGLAHHRADIASECIHDHDRAAPARGTERSLREALRLQIQCGHHIATSLGCSEDLLIVHSA